MPHTKAAPLFDCPQGEFTLHRLPLRPKELLQAWDATDEYLLQKFAEFDFQDTAKVLLINEQFGALSTALSRHQLTVWSDSYLTRQACELNLTRNHLPITNWRFVNSLETPDGPFDAVLIKVPKTLALLEDFMLRLRSQLNAETLILISVMQKNYPPSLVPLIENCLGAVETYLNYKKARLFRCRINPALSVSANPYPSRYLLENTDQSYINHANVFSREQLDIGARFFLSQFSALPPAQKIADLGCGNGILGINAAQRFPNAKVFFVDESYMAITSARENYATNVKQPGEAEFIVNDGLEGFERNSLDLVLCNPPFHQQQNMGDYLALRMFRQAREALKSGGQMWIVANRHLNYYPSLKRLFMNCETCASNPKFTIYKVCCK